MTEILSRKAKKAYNAGKFDKAAALFQEAQAEYEMAGDELNAAEMANNKSVALLQGGNPQKSYEAALGTDLIFKKHADILRQAMALGNQAAALEEMGDLQQALFLYQEASSLLKDSEHKEIRSIILKSISVLQIKTGDQLKSLASMQAALDESPKLNMRERILKKVLNTPFKMMKK
ncbi:MAG: hypothetical protein JEZ06_16665 [Anaerolineaceae bacterium]|nr:hypothetical protein [Anaerolineaceae bacterium]